MGKVSKREGKGRCGGHFGRRQKEVRVKEKWTKCQNREEKKQKSMTMMNLGTKTLVSKGHFPVGLEMTYVCVPTAPAHQAQDPATLFQ